MNFNDLLTDQIFTPIINSIQPKEEDKKNTENDENKKNPTTGESFNLFGIDKTTIEGLSGDLNDLFSLNNILFVLWFLVIYLIIYYVIKTFYRNEADPLKEQVAFSRGIDIFIFGLIIILTIYSYWNLTEHEKQHLVGYLLNWTQDFYNNPVSFLNTFVFLILFYCFVYLCGVPMTKETRPLSIYIIEQKTWLLLISILIVYFFKYVLGIPIIDIIFGLNGGLVDNWYKLKTDIQNVNRPFDSSRNKMDVSNNKMDVSNNKVASSNKKAEVFNIANSLYTYEDAQAVCKAYGSRLATVDELNDAYNKGADWCVNSWSADRHVLFPTQKATYDKLQNVKGAENSCGRTGVNGGRVNNTSLRFGINCFGVKPEPSRGDKMRMNAIQNNIMPKTKEEVILQAKVDYWKNHKDQYTILNPFNTDKWSEV